MPDRPEQDSRPDTKQLSPDSLIGKVHLRDVEHEEDSPLVKTHGEQPDSIRSRRSEYQVLGEIARGGVGVVLKGHDPDLGRDVAMKVMRDDHVNNELLVQRFVEEAQIGGQLQHPGIVPVYELGQGENGRPYFTMKLIKGRTLAALLSERSSPQTDQRRFLSIFEQICQTMGYAHTRGVIHRDLKPANVMVGAFGEIQVVDWGFAKVVGQGGVEDEKKALQRQSEVSVIETVRSGPGSSGSDSVVGSVLGTPGYMPPEQARGDIEKIDERSDVFSLGAMLCEILTGKGPFAGSDNLVIAAAEGKLDGGLQRLEECDADPGLVEICKHCLAPAPMARPANARVLATKISEHLASVEERARQAQLAAAAARVRTRMTIALASAVLLGVIGLGGGTWWIQQQKRARLEQTSSQVSQILEEAMQRRGQSLASFEPDLASLDAALVSVERAEAALQAGVADDALKERVVTIRETLLADRVATEARAAKIAKDDRLLDRVRKLREMRGPGKEGMDRGIDAFERSISDAFQEYGLDLVSLDVDEACSRIAESDVSVELAGALDDWAELRRRAGDVAMAEKLTVISMAADPDELRSRLREAVLNGNRNDLLDLAHSTEFETMPPATQWMLGNSLARTGDLEGAIDVYRRGLSDHPGDFRLRITLAEFESRREELAKAEDHLRVCVALRPDSWTVRRMLASVLEKNGNSEAAFEVLRDCLRIAPESAELRFLVGQSELEAGREDAALQSFEKAIELDPDRAEFRMKIGMLLAKRKEYPAAEAHLRRATQHEEDSLRALVELGWVLAASGRRQEGADAMRECLEKNPLYYKALSNLALLISNTPTATPEEVDEALGYARQTLRTDPNDAEALALMGMLQFRNEQFEAAQQIFDRMPIISDKFPYPGWHLYFVAMNHWKQDQVAEADDAYQLAQEWKKTPFFTRLPWFAQVETEMSEAEAKELLGL